MSAIVLGIENLDSVIDLLKNRSFFSKQTNKDQVWENLISKTQHALSDRSRDRIIGYFVNDSLEAILAQSFSNRIPIWIMQYYATKTNNILLGKGYGEPLEACFIKAMTDAEAIGIYDFWWSVPVKYAKNGPRMQKSSPSWIRYEVYTDAVISANTFPKYELHTQAYGSVLKPHDVFIRHAVCKQEFRSVPLTRQYNF